MNITRTWVLMITVVAAAAGLWVGKGMIASGMNDDGVAQTLYFPDEQRSVSLFLYEEPDSRELSPIETWGGQSPGHDWPKADTPSEHLDGLDSNR